MLILIATLALGAGAVAGSSPSPDLLPDTACMVVAQDAANAMQAAADEIAGKHVVITVRAGAAPLWTRLTQDVANIPAEIGSDKAIIIHSGFCSALSYEKGAIMAHEIGHLVDFTIDDRPVIFRLPQTLFSSWTDRQMEQVASKYGREILIKLGGNPNIIQNYVEGEGN